MIRSIHPSLKFATALIIAVLLGYYIYTNTQTLLTGPRITLHSPEDGAQLTASSTFTLTGSVENATTLTLNGREIFIDEQGDFAERLLPLPGYNIITITATDKFNRTKRTSLELTTR